MINIIKDSEQLQRKGFALIASLTIMVLLVMITVGMLVLSTSETKSSEQSKYKLEAQANARVALMIALSEAQEALGPDRRISSYATILDENEETQEIDGVDNARLLGVWDSWGTWLNADYQKGNGDTLVIRDTYEKGREKMFRRWLVSGDEAETFDYEFAKSGNLDSDDAITLVGAGTVADQQDYVRATLIEVEGSGKIAWWVGGNNQAADVLAYGEDAPKSPDVAELNSGDYGVHALDEIDGFENLPTDENELQKVLSPNQLELASVDRLDVTEKYFDVTQGSAAVVADVRWGGLKKDLNLLFELNSLPSKFQRDSSRAPGPRPMSNDLRDESPVLANREFSSFEQMREFYRSYKNSGTTPVSWNSKAPYTKNYLSHAGDYGHAAEFGYRRMPVVAKYYSIYSTLSSKVSNSENYNHDLVFSTVMVLWNPYNVPLEVPDGDLLTYTLPYKILPSEYSGYKNGNPLNGNWIRLSQGNSIYSMGQDWAVPISSGSPGNPIRFEPGQFRIFSKKGLGYGNSNAATALTPGYDPSGAFGQRLRVYSNKPKDASRWGVAIRLAPEWNGDGTSYWWGGNPGAFGNLIWNKERSQVKTMGTMYDWTAEDYDRAEISGTGDLGNKVPPAEFDASRVEQEPFCVVGMTLKSSYFTGYGEVYPDMPDYRSKNWLQGLNSVSMQKMSINYDDSKLRDMQRLDSGYVLQFGDVTSVNDVSKLFNIDAATQTLSSIGPDELVYAAPTLEVPTAPVTSIAGFAGMRLTPGWFQTPPDQAQAHAGGRVFDNTEAYVAGVPGIGIGNSFAQPTIPAIDIYKYHDVSKNNPSSNAWGSGVEVTDSLCFSDYWDHALLVNDGLWDSWFTSSMTDATRPSASSAKNLKDTVEDFLKHDTELPYKGYQYWKNSETNVVLDISKTLSDEGYKTVSSILKSNSAFNVNSTSVDAWLALFSGLQQRDVVFRDSSGALQNIDRPSEGIILSRFATAISDQEAEDPRLGEEVPGVGRAWTGVRHIGDTQLRKLAEECVKQVKLRGPFLNMSDFINRRLSPGVPGLSGALQAAIDYDDESPDSSSINYRYKQGNDMIKRDSPLSAAYPNQMAAAGSRFTGAPGYVVQSDLLRPLGNALTVRDDTLVIRAYGESVDSAGKVMSRAWCEATVQRTPHYVDPSNAPEEPMTMLDSSGNPSLNTAISDTNRRLGRRLQIISFRWLNADEI